MILIQTVYRRQGFTYSIIMIMGCWMCIGEHGLNMGQGGSIMFEELVVVLLQDIDITLQNHPLRMQNFIPNKKANSQ